MATTSTTSEARFTRSDGAILSEVDARTRFVVMPISAPSVLGLFGFAGATFMVAANLAGWYGGDGSARYLFPFAATFGGVAQFAAGQWAFRARDPIATAMHGMWGAFWVAFGLLHLLDATGTLTLPTGAFPELGFWFLVLAAITGAGCVGSVVEGNGGLTIVLAPLAVGSALIAIHDLTGGSGWQHTGGWVLIASSFTAFYVAFAMMLQGASGGRVVLPLMTTAAAANVPGRRISTAVGWAGGEPGVRQGQ
jgi:succinate-acetate transporter protein